MEVYATVSPQGKHWVALFRGDYTLLLSNFVSDITFKRNH